MKGITQRKENLLDHINEIDLIDRVQRASREIRALFPNVRFWHFSNGTEYEVVRIFADDGEIHIELVERKD